MNSCRFAVRRRHKCTCSEFELNHTVMDASSHNAIEINEWSAFRASFGELYGLHGTDRRAGVVNHVYDCRSSFLGVCFFFGVRISQGYCEGPRHKRSEERRVGKESRTKWSSEQ